MRMKKVSLGSHEADCTKFLGLYSMYSNTTHRDSQLSVVSKELQNMNSSRHFMMFTTLINITLHANLC